MTNEGPSVRVLVRGELISQQRDVLDRKKRWADDYHKAFSSELTGNEDKGGKIRVAPMIACFCGDRSH